ncbi:MAG: YgiQ family radical SAM protein [Clostridium sp.]|nr:YgiQ family radical SAM protein [Clostridium sp.]
MSSTFLPITKKEALERGWDQLDFVYIIGDAYVDHPSFGAAIISRLIESLGFSIGIISQPVSDRDYQEFGKPKYAFLVTGGNIDSMVAHYTAAKRKRSDDAYTPGGKAGRRPDRATIVYSRKLRELYPDSSIVIGGLEASLRRFAHYDYWDDAVRPSILIDSQADLLLYGMGEKVIKQLTEQLQEGKDIHSIRDIRGTCYLCTQDEIPAESVSCASFRKVSENKESYAKAHQIQNEWQDAVYGKIIIQKQTDTEYLVQNPPMPTLTREELDEVFKLPFTRTYHPSYEKLGGVDAIEEVEFSIMQNRGCFGNCNFCAITFHQGRQVVSRSEESIIAEAEEMTRNPRFKGYIHDVGGPTANFRYPSCKKQLKYGLCQNRKCLAPKPCPHMDIDHSEYIDLLRKLRKIKGVKKVFVRSGIRYDYAIADPDPTFMQELVKYHISGQLKVAPEHCVNHVLDKMGKPHVQDFDRFCKRFYEETKKIGKEQYLVPYLMSSHPGCTIADAVELAVYLKKHHMRPEQVQDFYPTPGTNSTCMFYTGLDPQTMEPVYVPKTTEEKFYQRTLLQYYKPENRRNVIEALIRAHREDLIGNGPNCLVTPDIEYIRTHKQQPAPNKKQDSRKAGKPAGKNTRGRNTSRKTPVVDRGGVLTNDTRSSRSRKYR